jgi:hypothetical protein
MSSLRWSLFALITCMATVMELGLFGVSIGSDSQETSSIVLVPHPQEQPIDWTQIPF